MSTQYASSEIRRVRTRPSVRALAVLTLGPQAMVGGVVWAFFQPWRLTLLHPYHQGFWWLVVEPQVLVVVVGIVFQVAIAPGIVRDLEEADD